MSTTYTFSTYTCVKYTTADGSFTWTPPAGTTSYDVLIVAGGGGGGLQGNGGGAGGAGGVRWLTGQSCTPGVGISGSVGAGGTAGTSPSTLVVGGDGGTSTFDSNTATGGGGGGAGTSGSGANNGRAGGSGGGGSGATSGNTATGGAGTSGQGSNGGSSFAVGSPAQNRAGGGGGGKGATGTTATSKHGGDGGAGFDASALLGTTVGVSGWFGGGGGGGTNESTANGAVAGVGGQGGGGAGANTIPVSGGGTATAGTADTGGGGGGCAGNQNGANPTGYPGAGGTGVVIVRYTTPAAPGVPTSVAGTPGVTTADLSWSAPASGGPVTSYEVRIDAGTPVTATSPHTFTGLTSETSYTLEVRAVGPGGSSSWVSVSVTTLEDVPYRIRVTVGDHVWDCTYGDTPDYGPTLPLTIEWQIPESADFFPAQASPMTASFGLVVESVADVSDIALMDPVLIEIWIPAADTDPWLYFPGVVSQLDATVGQGGRNLLQVFVSDPIYNLAVVQVGLDPLTEESEFDRVDAIAADGEFTTDWSINVGASGTLAGTTAGSPTDALTALQTTLRDVSDLNDSFGSAVYGRVVYAYDPTDETLYLRVLDRLYYEWPATLGDDGTLHRIEGVDGSLDGCLVTTGGTWSRLPMDRPTWVIVDGITFGTADKRSDVLIRSTSYVDSGGSATARDRLGNVLLPPDEDPQAWRANTFRYLSWGDPEPVRGWFGQETAGPWVSMPWADGGIRGVFVEPVAPELTLDGRTWLSGTLTGARFTLPPGGRHYIDVTLRPELYEVNADAISSGPLEWADVDAALTWADLDPLLAWRDLRLAGGT